MLVMSHVMLFLMFIMSSIFQSRPVIIQRITKILPSKIKKRQEEGRIIKQKGKGEGRRRKREKDRRGEGGSGGGEEGQDNMASLIMELSKNKTQ